MADSQQPVEQQVTKTPASEEKTQQVTSKTPATKQKNPKRVAAGIATAKKTRLAREAQKKALIEAQSIIANNEPKVNTPSAEPPVDTPSVESNKITTTQWLSSISIILSVIGSYYKREEIKRIFTKKTPPSPVLPRASPPSPEVPRRSIRKMD